MSSPISTPLAINDLLPTCTIITIFTISSEGIERQYNGELACGEIYAPSVWEDLSKMADENKVYLYL